MGTTSRGIVYPSPAETSMFPSAQWWQTMAETTDAAISAGDGAYVLGRDYTIDVARQAPDIDLTGVTAADAYWDELTAAAPVGATFIFPPGATIRFASARTLTKRSHFKGNGVTFSTTTSAGIFALVGSASGSTFERVKFQGVSPATYAGADKALNLVGTPTDWVDGVQLRDCAFDGFGYGGVYGSHVSNFEAWTSKVTNSVYAGFQFLSPLNCNLWNCTVDGLVGKAVGLTNQSYPIAWTRDSTVASTVTHPNARNCTVWGGLIQNTGWEGVDTHGGINIRTIGTTIRGCNVGVSYVPCPNTTNTQDLYAPVDCLVLDCTIESGVTDGAAGPGIRIVGANTNIDTRYMAATGKILGNTIRGHGYGKLTDGSDGDSSNNGGAIQIYETDGVQIDNNTIVEPSPFGIVMYYGNTNTQIGTNHVIDAWSDKFALPAAVAMRSRRNDCQLGAVKLSRGTKTATNVNAVGFYMSTTVTNFVTLSGGEDFFAATTAFSGGTTGRIRGAIGGSRTGIGAAVPDCNVWRQGDQWWNSGAAAAGSPGWVCTASGGGFTGTWAAATAYTTGTWIRTSAGKVLECITAGTSGATRPEPTAIGQVVTDNTVTWIYRSTSTAVFKIMAVMTG